MDPTEKLVSDHLTHRGYTTVVYEPDGNIPPDFLVDGVIAIEVRRLNQNHFDGAHTKGIEETAISLWHKIKLLVDSLGTPVRGESWFVYFHFTRPVEPWKTLGPILRHEFRAFMQSTNMEKGTIAKGRGFEL